MSPWIRRWTNTCWIRESDALLVILFYFSGQTVVTQSGSLALLELTPRKKVGMMSRVSETLDLIGRNTNYRDGISGWRVSSGTCTEPHTIGANQTAWLEKRAVNFFSLSLCLPLLSGSQPRRDEKRFRDRFTQACIPLGPRVVVPPVLDFAF